MKSEAQIRADERAKVNAEWRERIENAIESMEILITSVDCVDDNDETISYETELIDKQCLKDKLLSGGDKADYACRVKAAKTDMMPAPTACIVSDRQSRGGERVKRHWCCPHRPDAHDARGCKSPLCGCMSPFGKMIEEKPISKCSKRKGEA